MNKKKMFLDWAINNMGPDFATKYWARKNSEDLKKLSLGSKKTIYLNCFEDCSKTKGCICDKTYKTNPYKLSKGTKCKYIKGCKVNPKDSFAQWGINKYGKLFLEQYWDFEKNELNPWKIKPQSNQLIYVKCQNKDYHGSYQVCASTFYKGVDCGYCRGFKTHPIDSFAQWGINNLGKDFLEKYWDYTKNIKDPWTLKPQSHTDIYLICQEKSYHGSYVTTPHRFYNKKHQNKCVYCIGDKAHPLDSFAQWGENLFGEDFLEKYWDYQKNLENPWELKQFSDKNIYINCVEEQSHGSYETNCNKFQNNRRCPICSSKRTIENNSFAQWGVTKFGENFLKDYWDYDRNKEMGIDPWEIAPQSNKYVYIYCQERSEHGSYKISCANFFKDKRCSFCKGQYSIHITDSLGFLYPEVNKVWSKKNIASPVEYSPHSNKTVYFFCDKHGDYERRVSHGVRYNFRCPLCSKEKNESFLQEKVRLYIEGLGYNLNHETLCSIKLKNPRTNQPLKFDNEVVELNLLIEVHGEQHYKFVPNWHKNIEGFEDLKWRDNFKKESALEMGYNYLEIPFWEEKNDNYKLLIDEKIKTLLDSSEP